MTIEMGSRLKDLRLKHKFTPEEVAEYLGITQGHLANIELNKRNIPLSQIVKLCDLYNCSEEYIICGEKSDEINDITFRKDNKNMDLKTIARMNRIINDYKLLIDLKEGMGDD